MKGDQGVQNQAEWWGHLEKKTCRSVLINLLHGRHIGWTTCKENKCVNKSRISFIELLVLGLKQPNYQQMKRCN